MSWFLCYISKKMKAEDLICLVFMRSALYWKTKIICCGLLNMGMPPVFFVFIVIKKQSSFLIVITAMVMFFYYDSLKCMEEAITYWIQEYEEKGFVRWSVINKKSNEVIGTIEVFHRKSRDYFNRCGLLRMDLRSDYETESCIENLLSILITPIYNLFQCQIIATKAVSFANERIKALKKMKFNRTDQKLVGHDGNRV